MPTLISVMSDYDMLSDDDQEKFKHIVLGRVVKSTTLNDLPPNCASRTASSA